MTSNVPKLDWATIDYIFGMAVKEKERLNSLVYDYYKFHNRELEAKYTHKYETMARFCADLRNLMVICVQQEKQQEAE